MNRIIGVDYGTKRVGIAISDGLGLTARPLDVVPRSEVVEYLSSLRGEYAFQTIVVGLPTGLSGDEGSSAEGARELGSEMAATLGVDITYVDERFTSRMAEEGLIEAGMKRRARREAVDKFAAAIILQDFLDSRATHEGNSRGADNVETPDSG